ncbi:hypothetical protein KAR91_09540 [Candidatus Pacearchaeota archaeon]|nr:hypothetical protein [Candidatus Pacearchaeota archaeon]
MSTYYMSDGVHGASRIMQENNSDPYANCDTEAPDFDVANKFCLETQLWYGAACNKDIASTALILQVQKDGGAWESLAASDLVAYDCSGLTEGNPQTSSNCSDPSAVECGSGFGNGVQCTDGAISHSITKEYYSNVVWGLDPASCAGGSAYRFRVYDDTNSTVVPGTVSAFITIAIALIEEAMAGDLPGSTGVLTRKVIFSRPQIGDIDGAGYLGRKGTLGRLQEGDLDTDGVVARKGTLSRFQDGAHDFAGEVYRIFTAKRSVAGAFDFVGTVVAKTAQVYQRFITGRI